MKKNTMEMLYNLVNGRNVEDMETLRAEVNAEWEKMTAKSNEKSAAYEAAKPVVLNVLRGAAEPMTVKEIYEACADSLPADFTTHKIQYAMREVWADEVKAEAQEKGPKVYSLA